MKQEDFLAKFEAAEKARVAGVICDLTWVLDESREEKIRELVEGKTLDELEALKGAWIRKIAGEKS